MPLLGWNIIIIISKSSEATDAANRSWSSYIIIYNNLMKLSNAKQSGTSKNELVFWSILKLNYLSGSFVISTLLRQTQI